MSNTRCITPIVRNSQDKCGGKVTGKEVPCGKCPACRSKRASNWSFRLNQEDRRAMSSYFITMTYSPEKMKYTKNGFRNLVKRDCQLFFKKLRFASAETLGVNAGCIKYYLVGEYGTERQRPHYHVLLFNANLKVMFSDRDIRKLELTGFDGQTNVYCKQWEHGHVTVGRVTPASVGYCLVYISKPNKIPVHKNDDRQPEFSLMSKGIGKGYLTDAMIKWHRQRLDERMYCLLNDGTGRKVPMPRYYKDVIYQGEEAVKAKEKIRAKVVAENDSYYLEGGSEYIHAKHEADAYRFKKMKRESKFVKSKF